MLYNTELLILIGIFVNLLLRNNKDKKREKERNGEISIVILLLALILLIKNPLIPMEDLLIYNEKIKIIKGIIIITLIIITLINNIKDTNIISLIMLSGLGVLIIPSSNNLLIMYLGIELYSLGAYILAAYRNKDRYSVEAGIKYFILGTISSGILLFGISLIYGALGTTNINEIIIITKKGELREIGILMILIGLLFKLASAPFHTWIPDVYDGSPSIVTAYFAITPKIAIVGILVILNDVIERKILLISAILSLIIGSLGALKQKSLKRFYAYSAIAHIGYILMGISAINETGIKSISIYIIIYILMAILFFSIYLSTPRENLYVISLGGLYKSYPLLAISMSIYLLSSAGVPPLAGFFGKYYILVSMLESKEYLLIITAIIISVISTFYYLRIIVYMIFSNINYPYIINISYRISIIISFISLFLVLIFLKPSLFIIN